MESIIRNVRDLEADNRHSLETVLGRPLQDDQQIIIRVLTPDVEPDAATKQSALHRAKQLSQQAAAHRESQGVTAAEVDDVVDEAMQHVRQRPSD